MTGHVAIGQSMLPAILPGAFLETERVRPDDIRVGDIVCYVGGDREVVAHRVIKIENGVNGPGFLVRGDAQTVCEPIESSAVALVVTRVSLAGLSYGTDGPVGRFFRTLALKEATRWTLCRLGAVEGIAGLIRTAGIVDKVARLAMGRRGA